MYVTDLQVRKLLMEHNQNGKIALAGLKAGMNRKTAAKYVRSKRLPSEREQGHGWQTRPDPFAAHWEEAQQMLTNAPELEGKALFNWLSEQHPGAYQEGQVRTFQRRLRRWRAQHGPEKEVYFPQEHQPGVRLSTDFTCANILRVTIRGVPFEHMLCHSVLSYSNWEWADICHSESLLALRHGLQSTLVQLGHVPAEHWTDHSTAATHEVGPEADGRRGFNRNYLDLTGHFGMRPQTIQLSKPHENGDVESANGVIKRRLKQHLLLRGNRDFDSVDCWRQFLENVLHRANQLRQVRLAVELAAMRPLMVPLLPEYEENNAVVSRWSTVRCEKKSYSVPSRLIGEQVRLRRYAEYIELFHDGQLQLSMPRLVGEKNHAVNYRHIIEWLLRKPGAFAEYRFREDLFPSPVFRRAYDRLHATCAARTADLDYLRLLRQAAKTMESDMERLLLELEVRDLPPRWHVIQEFWLPPTAELPDLKSPAVVLQDYDGLLSATAVAS